MNPVKKILVPIDLSAHSLETVRFAADMARRYAASLTILHVHSNALNRFPEGHAPAGPNQPTLLIAATRQLSAAKAEAMAAGTQDIEVLLIAGGPSAEIVHLAAEQGYDLIVMGTHQRTGCERIMFGSVTESVLRAAPCPLVSVRLSDTNASAPAHRPHVAPV